LRESIWEQGRGRNNPLSRSPLMGTFPGVTLGTFSDHCGGRPATPLRRSRLPVGMPLSPCGGGRKGEKRRPGGQQDTHCTAFWKADKRGRTTTIAKKRPDLMYTTSTTCTILSTAHTAPNRIISKPLPAAQIVTYFMVYSVYYTRSRGWHNPNYRNPPPTTRSNGCDPARASTAPSELIPPRQPQPGPPFSCPKRQSHPLPPSLPTSIHTNLRPKAVK
jgi:hypothetical protein